MSRRINLTFAPGLVAAALFAWGCDRSESPASPRGVTKPSFGMEMGGPCPAAKMTGGGRIDFPPGTAMKNPPSSHMYQTFGAHVISNGPDMFGNCQIKGQLEWVDHSQRPNGRPLNLHSTAITFVELHPERTDCRDGALRWGGTLVRKNDGAQSSFEVFDCDDGEPGVGHDGFGIRAPEIMYDVTCRGLRDPLCILTGGNRQFHPTH